MHGLIIFIDVGRLYIKRRVVENCMDRERKGFVIVGILCLILSLLVAINESIFSVKKGETTGIIQSDGYLYTKSEIMDKQTRYVYAVKYEVNGIEYESSEYVTLVNYYNKGDRVAVWYNKENPWELYLHARSVTGIALLLCGIIMLIEAIFRKK